jgi:predicted kinase
LAASNLANGLAVVADCVNPGRATREGWRTTAASVGARIVEIEIICSDLDEHRRRVETRQFDIDGLILPSWQHVLQRDYTSWVEPHLVIDTAGFTPDQAITVIEGHIAAA